MSSSPRPQVLAPGLDTGWLRLVFDTNGEAAFPASRRVQISLFSDHRVSRC